MSSIRLQIDNAIARAINSPDGDRYLWQARKMEAAAPNKREGRRYASMYLARMGGYNGEFEGLARVADVSNAERQQAAERLFWDAIERGVRQYEALKKELTKVYGERSARTFIHKLRSQDPQPTAPCGELPAT